jgi:hypothetical protein
MRNGPPNHVGAAGRGVRDSRDSLGVDDDLGIVHLPAARGGTLVVIRLAARVAGSIADRIDSTSSPTAATNLFSFGARAVSREFNVPGFLRPSLTDPRELIALLGVVLLVLRGDFPGVVNVEPMRVLCERCTVRDEQP